MSGPSTLCTEENLADITKPDLIQDIPLKTRKQQYEAPATHQEIRDLPARCQSWGEHSKL